MKISAAARASGLSPYTIRYYEKSGMLPTIARRADGHRHFTDQDIDWLTLLFWLRETGMPMKKMRQFTDLAKVGPETVSLRRELLLEHAASLRARRISLERCDQILATKIASYDDKLGSTRP